MKSIAVVALLVVLVALPARAADGPAAAAPPAVDSASEGLKASIFGRVGFGQIDEDFFLSVAPGTVLRFGDFGFGIEVPLRFRVVDESPLQSGVLRDEDWDEVSDFTKILRFFEYRRPSDPIYVRVGELVDVTLGHGTIVDHYYNTVDIDHYQTGVTGHYDTTYGGGELLLDNLVDPNILALRGYVRPLSFFDLAPIFRKLVVGLTYASDYQAPSKLRLDADGIAQVTGDGELDASTEVVSVYGLDLGWEVLRLDWIDLTPYFDLNFLDALGTGVHVGVLTNFRLPAETTLFTRFEYRYLTQRYAAGYFNSLYEIERFRYRSTQPKIRYLEDLRDGDGWHGFYGELTLLLLNQITISAIYEDYQGSGNSNLAIRLRLPWLGPVLFQAYYAKRNFGSFEDIFELDGALLVAEARVKLLSFLYVYAEYARQWHLVGKDAPTYETVNDWDVGIGAAWEF